jgi:predicted RNase H-like HicB family nuclease
MERHMKTVAVRIDYDPETKTYGATSEDLPDVYAIGDSRDDVLARFVRAAKLHLEALRERGEDLGLDTHPEIITVAIEAA